MPASKRQPRAAAQKAKRNIKKQATWLTQKITPFHDITAITQPQNRALEKAYRDHKSLLVTHVRHDGIRGAHIGKGTKANYDFNFQGRGVKK